MLFTTLASSAAMATIARSAQNPAPLGIRSRAADPRPCWTADSTTTPRPATNTTNQGDDAASTTRGRSRPMAIVTAASTPAPTAAAHAGSPPNGPSERRPERRTSSASSSSRSPILGCASGIGSVSWAGRPSARPAYFALSSSRGWKAYSSESTSASQEASMMFSETPIVPHSRSPSEESRRTRVTAPVPWLSSRIRTL